MVFPTQKDVARLAGVSTATVSRVVGGYGHVKESTRKKVEEAAAALGYRPNAIARSMVRRTTQTIGLIISDISNPFFPEVVRGVEDVAHSRGYSVILCNSDEDAEKEKRYSEILLAKQVDGLIVATTTADPRHLSPLALRGVPVVLLDRDVREGSFDVVKVDNADAASRAVEHLFALGHRRVGIISGPTSIQTARERLEGYRRAHRHYNIAVDRRLIYQGDFKESGGYNGARALMEQDDPPTAIFTANNLTTTGALAWLREQRLRIPEDVSLVAFDDMTWMRLVEPPLTVVQQPAYLMGTTVAELLFQRLEGKVSEARQVIQLQSNLIVRGSCSAPRTSELSTRSRAGERNGR